MDNRTVLVLQGPDGSPQDLSPIAQAVGTMQGHMTVIRVGAIPPIPAYEFGAMPYGAVGVPDTWITTRQEMIATLTDAASETADYLAKAGVSGETGLICDSAEQMDLRVARRAVVADLAVVMGDLRASHEVFDSIMHGLIFNSPIPVVVNATAAALAPSNVLIAWNGTLPAARAVHAALPMLRAAKAVTICVIDPQARAEADGEDPGTSLAAWLSHHGCKVTVQQLPDGGHDVSDVVLRSAKEAGADLVVMGAYGHSRMRQWLFGGTTRTMIAQTGQAVMMAH